jgi:hypothetical protein
MSPRFDYGAVSMRVSARHLILAACLLSLSGCASFLPFGRSASPGAQAAATPASPPASPGAPTSPAATPAPSALPAAPQGGTIEIVNRTQSAFDSVTMARCDSSAAGAGALPAGQTIAAGASRSFPVAAGCWNVGVGVTNVGQAQQRIEVQPAGTVQYVIN